MDSKLEAHIDEIFIEVPKTDKMVTMINRIKSKANSKFLQIRDQGYSRSVAFNEVDDWLMKAKVIVDEEAGKLTPAELATIKSPATPYNAPAGEVVSNASLDDGEAAVVVERDYDAPAFEAAPVQYDAAVDMSYAQEAESFASEPAPAEEATAVEPAAEKPAKEKHKKDKKKKKDEVEEDDIVVPVKSSGVAGKVIGSICLVGGIALVVVAALMIVGII